MRVNGAMQAWALVLALGCFILAALSLQREDSPQLRAPGSVVTVSRYTETLEQTQARPQTSELGEQLALKEQLSLKEQLALKQQLSLKEELRLEDEPALKMSLSDAVKMGLCELRHNKQAAPWILKGVLCWRAVARQANISWVLASGTLLGAIRNGQVIPWDGDADTMIASTAEWARVYPLYFRDPSKLETIAAATAECQDYRIIFPPSDAFVAARVVLKTRSFEGVDITAPYIGNYSTQTPRVTAAFERYGFNRHFEDTRCVRGCPFFVNESCLHGVPFKSRAPKIDAFDAKCAAFVDHFMGTPVPCSLGGHAFRCPERFKEMLVNDYGTDWRLPMYQYYANGRWRREHRMATEAPLWAKINAMRKALIKREQAQRRPTKHLSNISTFSPMKWPTLSPKPFKPKKAPSPTHWLAQTPSQTKADGKADDLSFAAAKAAWSSRKKDDLPASARR